MLQDSLNSVECYNCKKQLDKVLNSRKMDTNKRIQCYMNERKKKMLFNKQTRVLLISHSLALPEATTTTAFN